MSLRTIQRLAIASALVLGGLSAGCDDDNDGGGSDGSGDGSTDGSGDGGGGDGNTDGNADGSTDGSADGGSGDGSEDLMCEGETEVCASTMAGPLVLDACCDDPIYANKCGAKLDALGAALGNGLAGCFSKGQPGDGSTNCATLLDGIDGTENGTFTVALGAAGNVDLPACCTMAGECGIVLDTLNTTLGSIEVGFGCVPLGRLTSLFGGGDADGGTPDAGAGDDGPAAFPYCVPGGQDADPDAACPPNMTIALADVSLCDALAGEGLPITENCDDTAMTPLWVCQLLTLPTITEGTVPTDVGDCLEFIPKYVAGCGVGEQGDGKCIPKVEQKFGCEDVTEVPGLPEYVCGCGEGEVGDGKCIPNVANTVCGAIEVTAGPIPGLPSGACGCGDEMIAEGCLPNIPANICGAIAGCTGVGTQGSCPEGQVCVDVKPDGAPDGVGDACITPPPT